MVVVMMDIYLRVLMMGQAKHFGHLGHVGLEVLATHDQGAKDGNGAAFVRGVSSLRRHC